ncbi:MAG TPA: molybdenum ABC transporter ATP-binding protein [Caulobacteraceae bacterium]|nr:molybdenum ABC transporter ATP-binding protein [Caulobacteraceae bacterium]
MSEARGDLFAAFDGGLGDFRLDATFTMPLVGVTGLMGPSGSGKTSLLRCIAGLERLPGRLVVGDAVWQDEASFLPAHRRPIGYVFQEASLLAHLSVRANLLYGRRRARTPQTLGTEEVVELLGLAPLLHRSTARLSGGERQRVAIGRALLSQPRLLMMDEPLSGLDADSKAEILPYIERLTRSLSIPVLYVSHDPREIGRLTRRVAIMQDGRVVGTDDPAAALDEAERLVLAMDDGERTRLAVAAVTAGLGP